jgi:hypothetical protein
VATEAAGAEKRPGLWWGDTGSRMFNPSEMASYSSFTLYWNGEKVAYVWNMDRATPNGYLWIVMGIANPNRADRSEPYYLIPFAACSDPVSREAALERCLKHVIEALVACNSLCKSDCACLRHAKP